MTKNSIELLLESARAKCELSPDAVARLRRKAEEGPEGFLAVEEAIKNLDASGIPSAAGRFEENMSVNSDADEFGGVYKQSSGGNYRKL